MAAGLPSHNGADVVNSLLGGSGVHVKHGWRVLVSLLETGYLGGERVP